MPNPPSVVSDPPENYTMAIPEALRAAKKQLRTLMNAKLSQIPRSSLESQSKTAFQALLNLRQYRDAKTISIYLSMPSAEIQTDEMVRHAMGSGKHVFVPYMHRNVQLDAHSADGASGMPRKLMDMVRLQGMEDYEGLERDAWGIPTITEEKVEGRDRVLGGSGDGGGTKRRMSLDLMLVPGVAFEAEESRKGLVKRLGHGKGFYDYFLYRYRSYDEPGPGSLPYTRMEIFGLALKEQLLGEGDEQELHVPIGPHDSLLDGLILGDGPVIEATPR